MSTWKKVITDGAALTDIGIPASGDKVLIQDITDDVIKYVEFGSVGGSSTNTNLAIANLTADNNRSLDMDGNSLTFDINEGDLTVRDSNASDVYMVAGNNLLTLGDAGMTITAAGKFVATGGIEQDEAGLTALGAYGDGADITFIGAS